MLVKYFDHFIVKLFNSEAERKSHKSVFFQAALLMKFYNDANMSAEFQVLKVSAKPIVHAKGSVDAESVLSLFNPERAC